MPVGGGGAWPGFETTRRAKLAARTARGRAAGHGHTKQPGLARHTTQAARPDGAQNTSNIRVIGQNVLVEGLVPGVVVGGGVVEFVEADCVAPAGDGAGGLVVLRGLLPGLFEGFVGGHGRQDCRCWLRVG